MTCVHPLKTDLPKPVYFTDPFCYEPHPLCLLAAAEVKQELVRMPLTEGKMFGVLVVERSEKREVSSEKLGFLAAYSGLLEGRNDWPYFVPPVFDAQQPDGYFKTKEREISLTSHLSPLSTKTMSQELQLWLFQQYRLLNATRWNGRLLCPEAVAICLPPSPDARLYGGVLVGGITQEPDPSSRTVLSRLSREVQAGADLDATGT